MPTAVRSQRLVQAAFHEVTHNPPAQLAKTRKKFGPVRAEKQRVAIALSKARKSGARIRRMPRGSAPFRESEIARGYRCL